MNVLIINPIVYTSETKDIPGVPSIKDSMIYDLCLAFHEQGHKVVLYACKDYEPTSVEEYPFEIRWGECVCKKIFMPHRFPVISKLGKYIKENYNSIDLIITGEVFSLNSLIAFRLAPKKTIIWHELALHNRMFKKIPSKVWYNVIARIFMRNAFIVARSNDARRFIGQYCKRVYDGYIDHGVNLNKFRICEKKQDCFIVCSQLIPRKRIDGILEKFSEYLKKYNSKTVLYIAGGGELENDLKLKARELNIDDSVIFKGKMRHEELKTLLAGSRALLINTVQDNSMISIVEAIAVGTPVVTTTVPLNSEYIIGYKLGIAKPEWDCDDLHEVFENNEFYSNNCINYREKLSTESRVSQFIAASRCIDIK